MRSTDSLTHALKTTAAKHSTMGLTIALTMVMMLQKNIVDCVVVVVVLLLVSL